LKLGRYWLLAHLLLHQYDQHKSAGQKSCSYDDGYQHFTSSFCDDILLPKNYKAKLQLEKSFTKHITHLYAKAAYKMMLKLTTRVNFINIYFTSSFCANIILLKNDEAKL